MQPYHLSVLEVLHTAYLKSLRMYGKIPEKVIVPYNKEHLTWHQLFSPEWNIFFLSLSQLNLTIITPLNKLVKYFEEHPV